MSKYATPGAFRTALTDKLRNLAERGPWNLQQLRRQFAYDRLLERLYMLDGELHGGNRRLCVHGLLGSRSASGSSERRET